MKNIKIKLVYERSAGYSGLATNTREFSVPENMDASTIMRRLDGDIEMLGKWENAGCYSEYIPKRITWLKKGPLEDGATYFIHRSTPLYEKSFLRNFENPAFDPFSSD